MFVLALSFLMYYPFLSNGLNRLLRLQKKVSFRCSKVSDLALPIDFGKNFAIPKPGGNLYLERINKHESDHMIGFNENEHTYSFNGKIVKTSVTQVSYRLTTILDYT